MQSGDKVLEVNDIMVTDATVERLSQIISNPQRVQTLTIERNTDNQPAPLEINHAGKDQARVSAKPPNLRSPVDRQQSLDLIGSPSYDQKFKKHNVPWEPEDSFDGDEFHSANSTDRKTRKKPERANSLPRM